MKVTIDISEQRMQDMLTNALEGGSNYWYTIDLDKTVFPPDVKYADFRRGGKFTDPDSYHHPLEIIPFTPGCAICIVDKEDSKEFMLGREQLISGAQIMAEKYPRHFLDMIMENDDAITGDVYLQCCLFGEVIYG